MSTSVIPLTERNQNGTQVGEEWQGPHLPQIPSPTVYSMAKSPTYHQPIPTTDKFVDIEAQSPMPRNDAHFLEPDRNPDQPKKTLRLRGGCCCCDCLYDLLRCLLCCCIFEAICDFCC